MKKNSSTIITIAIAAVTTIAIGLLLLRTGPGSAQPTTSTGSAGFDDLINKPLPAITLADKDGKIYPLDSLRGKDVVLFFSEGLMCYPACWDQIASLGTDTRFNTDSIAALSVIADKASDWQQAINKMPALAKSITLFDENANAARTMNLLNTSSSMHKGMLPGHTYIVLDKQGVVRYVYDDPNMALNNDMLLKKMSELN